jgi:Zn-dependent protease
VPVNSRKFHNYRRGDIIVSAAGVTTNLFLSILFAGLFVLLGLVARTAPAAIGVVDTAQRMMVFGIYVNLLLCFFNLIPLPPLDGSHLLYHALPPRAGAWYRGLGRFGYLPLFAMMFLFQPVLAILLTPARAGLIFLLRLILPYRAGDGWNIFS